MTNWIIPLTGHPVDLSMLADQLIQGPITVIEDEGAFYLRATELDALSNHVRVLDRAKEMMERVGGLLVLIGGEPVGIQDVAIELDAGQRRRHYVLTPEPVRIRIRGLVPNVIVKPIEGDGEEGILQEPRRSSDLERDYAAAQANPDIDAVLKAIKPGSSYVDLYWIYEMMVGTEPIRDFEDRVVRLGWATRRDIGRFTHTANSPTVLGREARHGREVTTPPADPMSLGDARHLTHMIVKAWIAWRIGDSNG